jgi:hypothetical protein
MKGRRVPSRRVPQMIAPRVLLLTFRKNTPSQSIVPTRTTIPGPPGIGCQSVPIGSIRRHPGFLRIFNPVVCPSRFPATLLFQSLKETARARLTGSDPRSGAVPRRAQYAGSGVSAGLRAGKSAPRWCRQCASTAMHTDWRDGPRPARRACELRCHAGAGPGDLRDRRRAGTVRICPPARTCSPVCPRPDVRSGPGLVPVCRADGFRLVGPTGRMCRRWLFRWPRHAAIPGRGLGRAVTRVPSGRAWQGRVRCFAARVRLHGAIRGQAAAGTGRQDGRAEAGPLPRRCSTPRRWTTCGQTDGGRQAPGRHASLAGLPDQRAAGACPDGGRSVVGPIPPWPCG